MYMTAIVVWLPCCCSANSYVRYYVQEFLSAVAVFLRCKDMRAQGLAESDAIADLHYKIMQVNCPWEQQVRYPCCVTRVCNDTSYDSGLHML